MTNDSPDSAARLSRIALRLGAAIAVHLGVLGSPTALLAQVEPEAEVTCGESEGPDEGVRLSWLQVPSEGATATLPGGVLTLRVQNLRAGSVRVRITVGADGGGPGDTVKRFPVLRLAGGASRDLAVDLGALGVLMPSMRFSGRCWRPRPRRAGYDAAPPSRRRLLRGDGRGRDRGRRRRRGGGDGVLAAGVLPPRWQPARSSPYGGDVLRDQHAAGDLNREVGTAVAMRLAGELGVAQRVHDSGGGAASERAEDLAAPTVSHDGPGRFRPDRGRLPTAATASASGGRRRRSTAARR